jgi:hypothetical protein
MDRCDGVGELDGGWDAGAQLALNGFVEREEKVLAAEAGQGVHDDCGLAAAGLRIDHDGLLGLGMGEVDDSLLLRCAVGHGLSPCARLRGR